MENLHIMKNWDKMATTYENFTNHPESYSNQIEWRAIKEILPNLKDKKILDLGCGTGRFSFLFEKLSPKRIVGVDFSEEMIKIGEQIAKVNNSIVELLNCSIENLSIFNSNEFDFIFSSTTLHYIRNLDNIMKEISRLMTDNGTCILSVIHPVYSACYPVVHENGEFPKDEEWCIGYLNKDVRAYIQPWIEYNPEIENYLSYSYHHTMSDYINSILKAGLQIKQLIEPLPPEEWKVTKSNRYVGYINTPTYAIFKIEKA